MLCVLNPVISNQANISCIFSLPFSSNWYCILEKNLPVSHWEQRNTNWPYATDNLRCAALEHQTEKR